MCRAVAGYGAVIDVDVLNPDITINKVQHTGIATGIKRQATV